MTAPLPYSQDMRTFLDSVRTTAGVGSETEAERLARATVSTLAQRITAGQINELEAGLPGELRTETTQRAGQAESFDKEQFLDRISGEINSVDTDEVEKQVKGVFQVLRNWAPEGQIDDTVAQLPDDLAALFR